MKIELKAEVIWRDAPDDTQPIDAVEKLCLAVINAGFIYREVKITKIDKEPTNVPPTTSLQ